MDEKRSALYQRFASELIATALEDTPVVLVTGPRQCGKTTLVQKLVSGNREFFTPDDDTVLVVAHSDPAGLVRGSKSPPRYARDISNMATLQLLVISPGGGEELCKSTSCGFGVARAP
jgi:ABC-type iron transport system FetAB ATPase subunit